MGPKNITMGCPNLVRGDSNIGDSSSHGYILRAHMNKHTLLNNAMPCIMVGYKVEYFVLVVVINAPLLKNGTKQTKP